MKQNHTVNTLKGIAILMVVFTHYSWTEEERLNPIFPFIINMAVPIFMIISGYVGALSFERNKIESLSAAYGFSHIYQKLIRYTVPYVLIIIWEVFDCNIHLGKSWDGYLGKIRWILNGTFGQGSYYYPMLIQLIFLFPIIYFIIEHNEKKGLWICFIINLIYEVLKWSYELNEKCYRLLIFRYIFLLATGVFASKYSLSIGTSIILTAIGGMFIGLTAYDIYSPRIITYWVGTCFIAVLWVVPFLVYLLRNINMRCPPLELLGKASYNIFFIQMVYYLSYREMVFKQFHNRNVEIIAGIVLCIAIGLLFYAVEKPLTMWIISKTKAGEKTNK